MWIVTFSPTSWHFPDRVALSLLITAKTTFSDNSRAPLWRFLLTELFDVCKVHPNYPKQISTTEHCWVWLPYWLTNRVALIRGRKNVTIALWGMAARRRSITRAPRSLFIHSFLPSPWFMGIKRKKKKRKEGKSMLSYLYAKQRGERHQLEWFTVHTGF